MRKAFTLVELLVVVVVIGILMSVMFKLSSVGGDSSKMNTTVDRMHRLENALSGYYAAFGTYPPVKLHGSRNPFLKTNDYGDQNPDGNENSDIWGWISADGESVTDSEKEQTAWVQVKAACASQPVACEFPFPEIMKDFVKSVSEKKKTASTDMSEGPQRRIFERGFDDGVSDNIGRFAPYSNVDDWQEIQLFRFGLMSFLLPRYLVMMQGNATFFRDYAQWTGNNTLPRDPLTGRTFSSWEYMQENFVKSTKNADTAHVANVPSQAACARWMASFDRSLSCNYQMTLFGVHVWQHHDDDQRWSGEASLGTWSDTADSAIEVHAPGGYENGDTSAQYVLDKVSIRDGWNNDFFYYSPAPYQSYIVWSAGPNGRTFPPWIAVDSLKDSAAKRGVSYWVRDDIVNMSH